MLPKEAGARLVQEAYGQNLSIGVHYAELLHVSNPPIFIEGTSNMCLNMFYVSNKPKTSKQIKFAENE